MVTNPGGHRLLPYEYGLAQLVLRRQAEHRTRSVLRSEENYGSDGVALMAAGLTNGLAAEMLLLLGILLVAAPRTPGVLTASGSLLLAAAMALMALTVVRLKQAARVGRNFRGEQAFQTRADR
jgi:hypothetical protein